MSTAADRHFPLPPLRTTRTGAQRRIGVELELGGMQPDRLAVLVAERVGGELETVSRYEHRIRGDAAGDWTVELDFAWLRERAREQLAPGDGIEATVEDLLRRGAEQFVPMEVVSPPLPMGRLGDCQGLVEALHQAGAQGTSDSFAYAFGMQFNPELPDTDADTVLAYLRAFLCLSDWLRERAAVDLTRRVTAFADPFPGAYVRRVMAPGYAPDMGGLIDDYLRDNPTRNRALDLLPLFAEVDEARLREVVDDPRVKPRPTLHYRLPNCDIGRADWSLHLAWYDWLQVEHLAADRARLNALCAAYHDFLEHPIGNLLESWKEHVLSWLTPIRDL